MAAKYSDADIKTLIEEKKPLPMDFRSKIRLREKRGHKEQELDVQGANGHQFRILVFYDYHIHTATERYQELGMREDSYAEPSDRFSDLNTAINCMLKECGFEVPHDPQLKLFEEV